MEELLKALASASPDDLAAWRRLVDRAGATAVATWLAPRALVACILGDTRFAAAALETLRVPDSAAGSQVTAAFPEVAALAYPAPGQVEHDPPNIEGVPGSTRSSQPRPLLDHIASRLLGKKLAGLEAHDLSLFQAANKPALSQRAFDELADTTRRVLGAGLGPTLRAAILHLDIAKTANQALRATWTQQGISLEVHNEAAAMILRRNDRAKSWGMVAPLQKLAIAWVEAHGLAGQHVRGEGPILMFAPLVAALRELAPALGRVLRNVDAPDKPLEQHEAIALALDGLHVLNACDTAAVREGLLDDALLGKLARVRDQLTMVAAQAPWTEPHAALAALAPPVDRARLADRLRSLRTRRQAQGEPASSVDAAVAAVTDAELALLGPALQTCQLWYCEAATSGLSPAAQLGVLAAAIGAARKIGVDISRPWHMQLRPLLARLAGDGAGVRYRLRLIEAALSQRPLAELLDRHSRPVDGGHSASSSDGGHSASSSDGAHFASSKDGAHFASSKDGAHFASPSGVAERSAGEALDRVRTSNALDTSDARLGPLGTLSAKLASATDPDAIVVDYVDTEESAALVTLLGLYETKSSVAFHQMLKALCDLYGLRKDELDRVNNEATYLASMNAARSDKERMLDYVQPGSVVEIGPGGGVVLELLEQRYPESEIIGVDLSREAIAALETRKRAGNHKWRLVLGAAQHLPDLVVPAEDSVAESSSGDRKSANAGVERRPEAARFQLGPNSVDTVIFCSILHEVYSYSQRGGKGFHLESVRDVIRAAWTTLRPGGRIVIRDGVMPPPATRRIRFIAPDARPTFDLFVAQFEGRKIKYTELAPSRVQMTAADAMEFLYTYTWGPASFPYEVRELYGILPYDDYVATVVDWVGGTDKAKVVDILPEQRSYLQPGYRDHLAGKIELTDEHDRPVELPDSNCLIVIERR